MISTEVIFEAFPSQCLLTRMVDPRNTTLMYSKNPPPLWHSLFCSMHCLELTAFSWIFETELLIIERRKKQLGLSKRELVTFSGTIFHYWFGLCRVSGNLGLCSVPQSLMYVKHHEILPNAFWIGGLYPVEYYFRRYIDRFLETTTAMTSSQTQQNIQITFFQANPEKNLCKYLLNHDTEDF